jgi:hypothetical protein
MFTLQMLSRVIYQEHLQRFFAKVKFLAHDSGPCLQGEHSVEMNDKDLAKCKNELSFLNMAVAQHAISGGLHVCVW